MFDDPLVLAIRGSAISANRSEVLLKSRSNKQQLASRVGFCGEEIVTSLCWMAYPQNSRMRLDKILALRRILGDIQKIFWRWQRSTDDTNPRHSVFRYGRHGEVQRLPECIQH